jgi:hypothetical protein
MIIIDSCIEDRGIVACDCADIIGAYICFPERENTPIDCISCCADSI